MSFDDPEVREFLARSMVVRLAALSPKGQPNIRCLWFVFQRGRIYMPTQETTPAGRRARSPSPRPPAQWTLAVPPL